VAPDEAEQEWLPDHLREPRPAVAGAAADGVTRYTLEPRA